MSFRVCPKCNKRINDSLWDVHENFHNKLEGIEDPPPAVPDHELTPEEKLFRSMTMKIMSERAKKWIRK